MKIRIINIIKEIGKKMKNKRYVDNFDSEKSKTVQNKLVKFVLEIVGAIIATVIGGLILNSIIQRETIMEKY